MGANSKPGLSSLKTALPLRRPPSYKFVFRIIWFHIVGVAVLLRPPPYLTIEGWFLSPIFIDGGAPAPLDPLRLKTR